MDQTLLNSFRDPALVSELLRLIKQRVACIASHRAAIGDVDTNGRPRPIRLMEVCGTHTVAIARAGFRSALPSELKLISGPGCPVCVTANVDIDRVIALTRVPGVVVATFGDMIRVPGSSTSLQQRKAEGAAIEVVYSPLDAIKLAEQYAEQMHTTQLAQPHAQQHTEHETRSNRAQIVLVGVGFETTTPLIASTIQRAAALGLKNFSVLAIHKRVPPALKALADDGDVALDALILPGHVSTILGITPYEFLASDCHIPACVVGFEPVDILQGIAQLLEQLAFGTAEISNAYKRAVMQDGNPIARAAIARVFEESDATWRGLGLIPRSGYSIRAEFSRFDAAQRFAPELEAALEPTVEPRACRCGDVLRGLIAPNTCPLFAKACTPQNPVGACMVSSEGSCAAYYRYQIKE